MQYIRGILEVYLSSVIPGLEIATDTVAFAT